MKKGIFLRITMSVFIFCYCLYHYIDKQSLLTAYRIQLPQLLKEIEAIEEESHRLQYEIDRFENPYHLMELARCHEFAHLKHPFIQDILTIPEGMAIKEIPESRAFSPSSIPIAVGAK